MSVDGDAPAEDGDELSVCSDSLFALERYLFVKLDGVRADDDGGRGLVSHRDVLLIESRDAGGHGEALRRQVVAVRGSVEDP